ncbi:GFA family protein [Aliiroseovarius sp. S1339]|uniref:GFA family protein n=1 Tax=Aliiroseovarius sp. S1339 TaxID=2936990 RepID=UPI0020BFF3B7|nr:GFA family protein [Aliiroseovarius sp. S1339]MCK8463397.1 GFA family protein [Aliiroseovarius sp. S1339]
MNGHCLCGAVQLSFEPKAPELHACHCDMCRRWAGSAFVEIDVEPGTLEVEGPVKAFASSDWAERAWCDTCGTTLWYHLTLPGHDDFYAISAGLVDDMGGLSMTKEIYIDRKPDGFAFAGNHVTQTKAEVEAQFASFAEGEPE